MLQRISCANYLEKSFSHIINGSFINVKRFAFISFLLVNKVIDSWTF